MSDDPMNGPRLYGGEYDETLYFDPEDYLEQYFNDHLGDVEVWPMWCEVVEWSTLPKGESPPSWMPTSAETVVWMIEGFLEQCGMEDLGGDLEDLADWREPLPQDIEEAMDKVRELILTRQTYLVADHELGRRDWCLDSPDADWRPCDE